MSEASELCNDAGTLATLDHAMRWAFRQEPRLEPFDVVIQDRRMSYSTPAWPADGQVAPGVICSEAPLKAA